MLPTAYQIAFASIKGITAEIAADILSAVGSEEAFFTMKESDLKGLAPAKSKLLSGSYRNSLLENAKRELDYIGRKGIAAYYFTDACYPVRFQSASDAPLLIYSVGGCDLNARRIVSIVGTRHATPYGLDLCRSVVRSLKENAGDKVVVVSGLAYGIDVAAHKAALAEGLPTVAVMAHGLDMIYPAVHRQVAADIVNRGGAVLTEYPSFTRVHRSNFLARNRIIAALSDCTVVVESAASGGALVTANIASSYGREVFAFPGRVGDEYSVGCNSLIRRNIAAILCGAGDLADAMQWQEAKPKPVQQTLFVELTADERKVCDALREKDTAHVGEFSECVDLPVHKLLSLLIGLEFKGVLQALPGNRYKLVKNLW